jgi:hypothetical protein
MKAFAQFRPCTRGLTGLLLGLKRRFSFKEEAVGSKSRYRINERVDQVAFRPQTELNSLLYAA